MPHDPSNCKNLLVHDPSNKIKKILDPAEGKKKQKQPPMKKIKIPFREKNTKNKEFIL